MKISKYVAICISAGLVGSPAIAEDDPPPPICSLVPSLCNQPIIVEVPTDPPDEIPEPPGSD